MMPASLVAWRRELWKLALVGEKCFKAELYQAAKLLFTSISNWARLAMTLIYLSDEKC